MRACILSKTLGAGTEQGGVELLPAPALGDTRQAMHVMNDLMKVEAQGRRVQSGGAVPLCPSLSVKLVHDAVATPSIAP